MRCIHKAAIIGTYKGAYHLGEKPAAAAAAAAAAAEGGGRCAADAIVQN